jgi:hypothetical protein
MAIWAIILFLSFYSFRDWFKPACVLVVMMAIYGHPSMPTNVLGVQGANPWNLLLMFTVLGFLALKKKENLKWDLDGLMKFLIFIYGVVIIVSFVRLYADRHVLYLYGHPATGGELFSEYFINGVKWVVPGIFIYMGATTESRRRLVIWSLVVVNILTAIIVIRRVPISMVTSGFELTQHPLKTLEQAFSMSRVNVAFILAGGSWVILFALQSLIKKGRLFVSIVGFFISSLALALTGGRTGYATWVAIGMFISILKWKKGIIIIPAMIGLVVYMVPSINERVFQGVDLESSEIKQYDTQSMTSGRVIAWPVAIKHIGKAPFFGYGGLAMIRTGAAQEVAEIMQLEEGTRGFPHPHNAYLFLLLDAGWIGAFPIFLFWLIVLYRSFSLVSPESTVEERSIGLIAVSLSLALLIAGTGSQNFFPTQSSIALWAAIGLMLRVYRDRELRREEKVRDTAVSR